MELNTNGSISSKLGPRILLVAIVTASLIGLIIFGITRLSAGKPLLRVVCDPSEQNSDSCSCPSGETKSSSGNCVQVFGGSCEKSTDCDDNLVCHSGKCDCRLSDQEFSKDRNFCVSRIGGPCIDMRNCPEFSSCKKFMFQEHGMCQCKSGFLASPDGGCEASYLQACSSSIPCDSISGLACIDSYCRCRNFGYFDGGRRICLGLVGSTCDSTLKEASLCVENAECIRAHPKLPAACKCQDQFSMNAAYICEEWSK